MVNITFVHFFLLQTKLFEIGKSELMISKLVQFVCYLDSQIVIKVAVSQALKQQLSHWKGSMN